MTKSSVVFTANTVRNFEIITFFERILAIGVCAIEQGSGQLRAHFSNTVFCFCFFVCLFVFVCFSRFCFQKLAMTVLEIATLVVFFSF